MIWKSIIIISLLANIWCILGLKSVSNTLHTLLKCYEFKSDFERYLLKEFKEGKEHAKTEEKNNDLSE